MSRKNVLEGFPCTFVKERQGPWVQAFEKTRFFV